MPGARPGGTTSLRRGEARRDVGGVADADLTAAIERLRRGERVEESARILHRRYYRPLRAYFLRKVASPEDALDLTQETFLRVYRGVESFRGGSSFNTWLFRIASNTHSKWREHRSRRAAQPAFPEPSRPVAAEPAAGGDDPLDHVLRRERHRQLADAIGELPDQQRRCMVLRLHHQRSYRQIAVLLGLSIETVKAHLFQGRKGLQQRIACAPETPQPAARGDDGDGETT